MKQNLKMNVKNVLLNVLLVLGVCVWSGSAIAADLNGATQAQFEEVKGIGAVKAKKILDERKKGPFKSWQDLIDRVDGVGPQMAKSMSSAGLTVNGQKFNASSVGNKNNQASGAKASGSTAGSVSSSTSAAGSTIKPLQNGKVAVTAKPTNSATPTTPSKQTTAVSKPLPASTPKPAATTKSSTQGAASGNNGSGNKPATK